MELSETHEAVIANRPPKLLIYIATIFGVQRLAMFRLCKILLYYTSLHASFELIFFCILFVHLMIMLKECQLESRHQADGLVPLAQFYTVLLDEIKELGWTR